MCAKHSQSLSHEYNICERDSGLISTVIEHTYPHTIILKVKAPRLQKGSWKSSYHTCDETFLPN